MGTEEVTGAVPEAVPVHRTGHDRVDAVLARAADLDTASVADHPRLYEELHAALVAELGSEPGTAPAGPVPGTATGQR